MDEVACRPVDMSSNKTMVQKDALEICVVRMARSFIYDHLFSEPGDRVTSSPCTIDSFCTVVQTLLWLFYNTRSKIVDSLVMLYRDGESCDFYSVVQYSVEDFVKLDVRVGREVVTLLHCIKVRSQGPHHLFRTLIYDVKLS